MPNHVTSEIIFRNTTPELVERIRALVIGEEDKIDFERLVPTPKNIWWGNVGSRHEKVFGDTGLDWSRKNWGTKWNAYGARTFTAEGDTLAIVFDTAWSPPWGWLVALFNTLLIGFEHNWLDEGAEQAVSGVWKYDPDNKMERFQWDEKPATDEMQKHMHMLRWGCESFPEEDEE